MKRTLSIVTILALPCLLFAQEASTVKTERASDGSVLPFAEPKSASINSSSSQITEVKL